jgi:hypothetical protein
MNVEASLRLNIEWFQNSGIMRPGSGEWGIGERIATRDNKALEMVLSAFPYYTEFPKGFVLEHRRPDCNFQTAWLFAAASEALNRPELMTVTENILDYLFHRSGLLNKRYPDLPEAAWEWSTNNLKNQFYYDDNGWNGLFELALARRYPALEERFRMRDWGLKLAGTLANALEKEFFGGAPVTIVGKPELPHWGALACMPIAAAAVETGDDARAEAVRRYFRFLDEKFDTLNTSEYAYILVGGGVAAGLLRDAAIRATVERAAAVLMKRMSRSGNIASEHYEIPNGEHLVDLVYTVNWALLGFQETAALTGKPEHRQAFEQLLALVTGIQDRCSEALFNGCWRGLYDLNEKAWAGGDLHEGGSGSIYSGWTNAPIAMALAHFLNGNSLAEVFSE